VKSKIRTFWYFHSDIKNEFEHFFSLELKKIRDDGIVIMDNNLSASKTWLVVDRLAPGPLLMLDFSSSITG
jgi:hypothetical protein